MAKNKTRKQKLQLIAAGHRQNVSTTNVEAQFLGIVTQPKSEKIENAYLALKYYQPEHECFSDWKPDELRAFSEFTRKLSQQRWQQIFQSGGSLGNKQGLGYTKHSNKSKLPNSTVIDKISPDIDFFELRVTQKARVHGFRSMSTFFLVWLDRNHKICPM